VIVGNRSTIRPFQLINRALTPKISSICELTVEPNLTLESASGDHVKITGGKLK
jgi:hypothetical protein